MLSILALPPITGTLAPASMPTLGAQPESRVLILSCWALCAGVESSALMLWAWCWCRELGQAMQHKACVAGIKRLCNYSQRFLFCAKLSLNPGGVIALY